MGSNCINRYPATSIVFINKIRESEKASTNQAKILGINWDIESDILVYMKSINPLYQLNEECFVYYVQFTIHSVL